ncbi:MAG: serine/threonine protein kinase [Limnohabitans sp.]|nr:serine/threonine protein kinase [Limnohabitans sp.]
MFHPYQFLTPDVVLDAIANLGLAVDGRMTSLSSYENRVYQVILEDNSSAVAKFYRPGRWSQEQIKEEHAFSAQLTQDDVPVVSPLWFHQKTLHTLRVENIDFYFSICPRKGGRAPELDDPQVLSWIGRFLARIHHVGEQSAFKSRPALNVQTFGFESRDWLVQHNAIPLEVFAQWLSLCNEALTIAQSFLSASYASLRLHGDCHPGNILWTPLDMPNPGPHFVDLDDARQGPAIQDLWMLQNGDRADRARQLGDLLEGYELMRSFNRQELLLIEPLRTLRIIHYSSWLARRQDDPAFAIHFPWFGTPMYWQGQADTLREQIEAMQEPPLSV